MSDTEPVYSWQEIAKALSQEKDPKRILELSEELNRLLSEDVQQSQNPTGISVKSK